MENHYPIRHIPWKRIFDLLFSTFVLLVLSPVFILISCAILIESRGGPIFFVQKRVGRGGKKFGCIKFRTMHSDAEEKLAAVLAENPQLDQEWKESRKLKNDPRITSLGYFLRKSSLDELPQFINVFKGDLSVVGPRPALEDEIVEYYGAYANKVLSIRPGVTGVWQVSGKQTNTKFKRRVRLDAFYVNRASFFYDLKLVLKTIPVMFFSR